MSRIGKKVIVVPETVSVDVADNHVSVKGPKGELSYSHMSCVSLSRQENEITVTRSDDHKASRAAHGLTRALIANMITGVLTGYSKTLDIVGVGFKVEAKGQNILLNLGFSHPIYFMPPNDIAIKVVTPTQLVISGIDKQVVGQVAAKIRSFKEPEPYKGKGIKYSNEIVRRKAGKTAGK